ncbi:hypothetical protein WMF45_27535 [Sorangium sp. So ce448]|uniref:hypothetical protein n=1 Tax=Sorangium sp. So ce448 TaxID=3133314 RepID=UPI003F5FF478
MHPDRVPGPEKALLRALGAVATGGLRGCLYDGAVWSAALSLPCEIARRLAIEGIEHAAVLRGPAIELLNEAARRESSEELRRRMVRLLRDR